VKKGTMKNALVQLTGATQNWIAANSSISDGPLTVKEGMRQKIAGKGRRTGGGSRREILRSYGCVTGRQSKRLADTVGLQLKVILDLLDSKAAKNNQDGGAGGALSGGLQSTGCSEVIKHQTPHLKPKQ
jgi:hypothetical protein